MTIGTVEQPRLRRKAGPDAPGVEEVRIPSTGQRAARRAGRALPKMLILSLAARHRTLKRRQEAPVTASQVKVISGLQATAFLVRSSKSAV
jgi:hypothetical protein